MVANFVEVHSRRIFVIAHHTMLKTSTHTKTRFYVYKSSVEKTELAYMKSHKMISQFTVYRIRLSAKRMRVCTECDVNWELFFPLFYGNSTAKTQSYFFMWHISMEYFTKQIFFVSATFPHRFHGDAYYWEIKLVAHLSLKWESAQYPLLFSLIRLRSVYLLDFIDVMIPIPLDSIQVDVCLSIYYWNSFVCQAAALDMYNFFLQ